MNSFRARTVTPLHETTLDVTEQHVRAPTWVTCSESISKGFRAGSLASRTPNGHRSHNSSRYARASRRLFRHDLPNVTHVGLYASAYKGTGTVPCNGTFSSVREHILAFRNPLPHKLSTDLGIGGFPRFSPGLLIPFWFCRSSSSPAIVFPLLFQWRPVWLRSKQDHATTLCNYILTI
ncbi:hypothetical protein Taro_041586 [Colocasia esculenta]|uniref:Uncharacterized protein n=1 Tax=Colocasia esculenta TaxID=4460 RepID=A0A843WLU3_COLES|nr:hypothetical protein [Colocasia esculenta]